MLIDCKTYATMGRIKRSAIKKGEKMASKDRAARKEQKLYWENQLSRRLEVLTEKGLEPGRIAKDPTVKKIRAKMRKTETRLRAIDELAKKNKEMIEAKAAKAEEKTKEKAEAKVETKAKAKAKEKAESKAKTKAKAKTKEKAKAKVETKPKAKEKAEAKTKTQEKGESKAEAKEKSDKAAAPKS